MTAVVFFFAFSSLLSNYVCAEANLFFLGGRRLAINALKVVTLMAIVFGTMSKLTLVWAPAEWAFATIRDYHRQSAEGNQPVFVACEADLPGVLDGDTWEAPERRQVGALPESLRIGRPGIRSSKLSRVPAT
jgi:alanine or glycine:cation symporter, AGCS family